MPNAMVAVAILGILAGVITATVFTVIPWAQDRAAKQDLTAMKVAMNLANDQEGRFLPAHQLVSSGYMSATDKVHTLVSPSGECFTSVARADSGTIFYVSNAMAGAKVLAPDSKSSCATAVELQDLVGLAGGTITMAAEAFDASGWGSSGVGQVGNGATGPAYNSPRPITALAGKQLRGIEAGELHSCAIADGGALCWGSGADGRLGNGSTAGQNMPVQVGVAQFAGKKVTDISAGRHTCAVASSEGWCWGSGANGRLGNGAAVSSSVPVKVSGMTGKTMTSISAGIGTTCGVADGAAYCWGRGIYGTLGNGGTADSMVPVKVGGLLDGKKVSAVSVGDRQACAVADGSAYCWGSNTSGQLGNGSTINSAIPVKVAGIPAEAAATEVGAGTSHSCAIAGGRPYCWGGNNAGQLGTAFAGTGSITSSNSARPVFGALKPLKAHTLSVGGDHSCVLGAGEGFCWGANPEGRVGADSAALPVISPQRITVPDRRLIDIAAGGGHSLAVSVAR